MKTESIQKIKELRRTANGLRTFFEKYHKATEPQSCDKYDAAFGRDNRFSVFSVATSFDSYTGYYGNSSCSTFSNGISRKEAEEAFVKWINLNMGKMFDGMAEILDADAKALVEAAEQEIEEMRKSIDAAKAA